MVAIAQWAPTIWLLLLHKIYVYINSILSTFGLYPFVYIIVFSNLHSNFLVLLPNIHVVMELDDLSTFHISEMLFSLKFWCFHLLQFRTFFFLYLALIFWHFLFMFVFHFACQNIWHCDLKITEMCSLTFLDGFAIWRKNFNKIIVVLSQMNQRYSSFNQFHNIRHMVQYLNNHSWEWLVARKLENYWLTQYFFWWIQLRRKSHKK